MSLTPVDPTEYFRDLLLVCCADPQWNGCPHPIAEHRDDTGACTVHGCRCRGLLRHPDGCIHTEPHEQG